MLQYLRFNFYINLPDKKLVFNVAQLNTMKFGFPDIMFEEIISLGILLSHLDICNCRKIAKIKLRRKIRECYIVPELAIL